MGRSALHAERSTHAGHARHIWAPDAHRGTSGEKSYLKNEGAGCMSACSLGFLSGPSMVVIMMTTGLIYTVNDVRLFSWAGKNRPADAPESSDQSTSTKHRDLDHIQVVSSTVHVFGNDDAK
jgi:hypothetical protein